MKSLFSLVQAEMGISRIKQLGMSAENVGEPLLSRGWLFLCLLLWEYVSDCITVYPGDLPAINVGYLKHGVHPWVSRSAFTPDDLSHEPLIGALLSSLLLSLDNHEVSWTN